MFAGMWLCDSGRVCSVISSELPCVKEQVYPIAGDGNYRMDILAAATAWRCHASEHARANGGKPWSYLLISHDAVSSSATLKGLAANFMKLD